VSYLLLPRLLNPIFKFQKTAQGGVWETLLSQRPVRQEGQQPNNHLKDHTPNFPDSPVFCLLGKREIDRERERENETAGFSQTILCYSQVQFTTVYKVLIIFFFFFPFRNTATSTTTTTTTAT
jgi:hypothetical protein